MKRVTVRLTDEEHTKLKLLSVNNKTTIQNILFSVIVNLLQKKETVCTTAEDVGKL